MHRKLFQTKSDRAWKKWVFDKGLKALLQSDRRPAQLLDRAARGLEQLDVAHRSPSAASPTAPMPRGPARRVGPPTPNLAVNLDSRRQVIDRVPVVPVRVEDVLVDSVAL